MLSDLVVILLPLKQVLLRIPRLKIITSAMTEEVGKTSGWFYHIGIADNSGIPDRKSEA
jgi:hypothetical protein